MIFGIGVDVLEAKRIDETLARFGARFIDHLLMPAEQAQLARTQRPARFLAMRFAAKEAIVKALGTGFRFGMWVRDTGFVPDQRGKPCVIFSERGRMVCERFGVGAAHISLTDEAGLVVAMAVAEKTSQV